jgi:hypothetical protein
LLKSLTLANVMAIKVGGRVSPLARKRSRKVYDDRSLCCCFVCVFVGVDEERNKKSCFGQTKCLQERETFWVDF